FREECEVKFWRQSNHLVQAQKIWQAAKAENPEFTCANMFWWYNMYSSADFSVTPRPMYPADGRKLPDVYSHPMDLRDTLQQELGQFPLFEFWGPKTTINSSKWIADASVKVDQWHDPTLTLIYLPHLDYNIQRYGNDFSIIHKDLNEIDHVLEDLIQYYEGKNAKIILLSEYGITDVNHPVDINKVLRKENYITVKEELGLELLDAGASKAFAVVDHQLAHVYVKNEKDIPKVKTLLEQVDGTELVLDEEGKKQHHIDHDRAGELVAVANKNSWFTYYYWLDDKKAPDFARTVDIHRKPGYDPVEMFLDPKIKMPMLKVGGKLIKKKLGFRYLMNVIPLDPTLVKGSHGRLTTEPENQAVLMSKEKDLLPHPSVKAIDVYDIIWKHIFN
nr:alkaline phosphatase family protein [Flammeovirgaceae bacterium]